MEIHEGNWNVISGLVESALFKNFSVSMATSDLDGNPHITPIGSLVFTGVGKGFYFENLPVTMPANIRRNPEICVMAVNSGLFYWLKMLFTGTFTSLPGVRLYGTAGKKRKATDEELFLWQQKIKMFKRWKGYNVLWKQLDYGREIHFTRFEPVQCGKHTDALLKGIE